MIARTYVPPTGMVDSAKFIIIGEQPGKTEVVQRKPFVGPAGKVLNECLTSIGIPRTDCYITNVIKDLDNPLYKYWRQSGGNVTLSKEALDYYKILEQELSGIKNAVLIPTGNVALHALAGRTGITKWRGSILEDGRWPECKIVPTLHPATVIPPKNQYLNKLLIQFDLKKALKVYHGDYLPLKRRIIIAPSFGEVLSFLDLCYTQGLDNYIVDFDIEIYNEEVSCISFALSPTLAISIPFVNATGDYFSIPQETEIWIRIAKILENPLITKRGQNLSFDAHFLLRKYGIVVQNMHDTMIAQKTIMGDYPVGLDFITSIWTDHPYYKAEGKKYFQGGGWEQLWDYNGTDSLICNEAFPKQIAEVAKQKNMSAYDRQRALIPALVYMQEHGIKVDVEAMQKAYDERQEVIAGLEIELNAVAGRVINANSPKQLKEYFYGVGGKGVKAYKSRQTGKATTNNDAMKRLAKKGFKEAKVIQQIRKNKKIASTYLNTAKVDPDGRIRCSYNPCGTRFSRISSSANIFGTGMNMQNWPHEIHYLLKPDDGYIFYSYDLAQAENRIVAYVGNVTPMIEAFEGGQDVHSLTAALIFQKAVEDVTTEDFTCPLGDGTHSERFWGKKANHGLNYDLGYGSFAYIYEIPQRDAKFIISRYHLAYPGVRNTFHTLVRKQLNTTRTLTNLMGRRTLFLGKLEDKTYKEAYSCIPQGTIGDVINERGVNYIYYNQNKFSSIELLNQVHDSVGFQIPTPPKVTWKEHARMLLDIKRNLEQPLSTELHTFTIPADLTMGLNFSKEAGREFKKNTPDNVEDFALKLEETYEELHAEAA